jgi:hypothetical protein
MQFALGWDGAKSKAKLERAARPQIAKNDNNVA